MQLVCATEDSEDPWMPTSTGKMGSKRGRAVMQLSVCDCEQKLSCRNRI